MPITISQQQKKRLPETERADIGKLLWQKSGGICFLCSGPLLEATENLVADHDLPEADGGQTELANLNLVHSSCNSFKRDHPSIAVRPYLALFQRIAKAGGFVRNDEASKFLGSTLSY
ncbi:MAG: HNH endonuclease signature motif containing protein [Vicinamibacterales bacterium]